MNSLPSLVVMMCLAIVVVQCQLEVREQRADKQKYCGRMLADTLAMVCKGSFAGWNKRNYQFDDNMLIDDLYNYNLDSDSTDDTSKWIYLARLGLSNPIIPHGDHQSLRFKRYTGIIEECCNRSCSIKALQRYCL